MAGRLYLVATPIGNLGDLSPRAVETLAQADFIAAEDTRVSMKLLNHFDIKKPLVSYHEHNRASAGQAILERLLGGEVCALVTDAGTPAISDPGQELAALLTAVYMFRASGALALLTAAAGPVLEAVGIPRETAGLVLVRPLSGSGALAVGSELMARYGTESYIGRCAAVMLGCTETTFYTVAVYFGAAGIRRTRYAIPAALCADAVGFLAAAWTVRWLM